ncbi:type III secretion system inner rod subunit SctI [Paraburkholderia sediminicola]|uniref:type III secretion system inner rod subunit SctI n=1 Tax=Paraburkholderia sediminicola TaxID=458836 RepID=UPI0038BBDA86
MSVNPVSMLAGVNGVGGAGDVASAGPGGGDSVSPGDEAGFQRAMSDAAARPEDSMLQPLKEVTAQFKDMTAAVPTTAAALKDPQAMLKIQEKVMEASNAVDITAKLAGSIAQAANKITSMQ